MWPSPAGRGFLSLGKEGPGVVAIGVSSSVASRRVGSSESWTSFRRRKRRKWTRILTSPAPAADVWDSAANSWTAAARPGGGGTEEYAWTTRVISLFSWNESTCNFSWLSKFMISSPSIVH
jgi:hypothetical protein